MTMQDLIVSESKEKIRELGWELLPHPSYCLDATPSDYHFFRSIGHFLREKKFPIATTIKRALRFIL